MNDVSWLSAVESWLEIVLYVEVGMGEGLQLQTVNFSEKVLIAEFGDGAKCLVQQVALRIPPLSRRGSRSTHCPPPPLAILELSGFDKIVLDRGNSVVDMRQD